MWNKITICFLACCTLSVTACTTTTYLQPTQEKVAYDEKVEARLHLAGARMHYRVAPNTDCYDSKAAHSFKNWLPSHYPRLEVVADYNDSLFRKIPSTSIGMPKFEPDVNDQNHGLPFKEIVINANEPITVSSWYFSGDGNHYSESCSLPDFSFIPEVGADYEVHYSFSLIDRHHRVCSSQFNQIIKDANGSVELRPVQRTLDCACK
jgi:hypothetical protein